MEDAQKIFGEPDSGWDGGGVDSGLGGNGGGGNGGGNGGGRGGGNGGTNKKKVPRAIPFKIGQKTYVFQRFDLGRDMLVQVNRSRSNVLWLNVTEYAGMPRHAAARAEHFLLKVLHAVGSVEHPDDPLSADRFVGEHVQKFNR